MPSPSEASDHPMPAAAAADDDDDGGPGGSAPELRSSDPDHQATDAELAAAVATFKVVHPADYARRFVAAGVRPDGRGLGGFRSVTVNVGGIGTADGSALARIGPTAVLCGVKAELANPATETPADGWLVPNVTVPPLCSPRVRPGPPPAEAQALSQWLADTLRHPAAVGLGQLCIGPGRLSWCLYLDAVVLNDEGNLADAVMLAAVSALRDTRLPALSPLGETDDLPHPVSPRAVPVQVPGCPIAVTHGLWEGKLLADPTREEEDLLGSSVTVTVGLDGKLHGVSKPTPSARQTAAAVEPLSAELVKGCIAAAKARAAELRAVVDAALGASEVPGSTVL